MILNLVDFIGEVVKLCNDWDEVVSGRAVEGIEKLGEKVASGKLIVNEDVKKKITAIIRSNCESDVWGRYLTTKLLKLIPKKEMTDDLKAIELLLMLDWNKSVREAAYEVAKGHGFSSPQEIYDELGENGRKKVRKSIKAYSKSADWEKRYIAIKAIVALNLVDLVDRLVELCADRDLDVRERALKGIKELGEKIASRKVAAKREHLDILINFFSEKRKDSDCQRLAAQLICLKDEFNSTQINAEGAFKPKQQGKKGLAKGLKQI